MIKSHILHLFEKLDFGEDFIRSTKQKKLIFFFFSFVILLSLSFLVLLVLPEVKWGFSNLIDELTTNFSNFSSEKILYLLISFLISFWGCFFIVKLSKLNIFLDTHHGPQKFHAAPTPRIGGLAIYIPFLVVSLIFLNTNKPFARQFFLFVLSAFFVFFCGLAEDITKKVSPKWRLLGAFLSGLVFYHLFKVSVVKVNLPVVDTLLSFQVFSIVFTIFAIAGVSHAFNIIDGFNGLSSGVAILVLGAYAYISLLHHDFFLLYLSLVSLSATLGFFLWNYPFGYIFLGDGGAYFLGFISATMGVLLVNRHPDVSPWFPLLLLLYPVWETIFSIYRRKFLKKSPPHMPDAIHFHQLLYKRITKKLLGRELNNLERNYFTTPFLWIMGLLCFVPAVIFWKNTPALMVSSLSFIAFYTWLYSRIVKFKTPKILKILKFNAPKIFKMKEGQVLGVYMEMHNKELKRPSTLGSTKERSIETNTKDYLPQLKAEVALEAIKLEAIKGEKSHFEVATKYEIHPDLVSKWKKQALEGLVMVFDTNYKAREKDYEAEIRRLQAKILELVEKQDFLSQTYQNPEIERKEERERTFPEEQTEYHEEVRTNGA